MVAGCCSSHFAARGTSWGAPCATKRSPGRAKAALRIDIAIRSAREVPRAPSASLRSRPPSWTNSGLSPSFSNLAQIVMSDGRSERPMVKARRTVPFRIVGMEEIRATPRRRLPEETCSTRTPFRVNSPHSIGACPMMARKSTSAFTSLDNEARDPVCKQREIVGQPATATSRKSRRNEPEASRTGAQGRSGGPRLRKALRGPCETRLPDQTHPSGCAAGARPTPKGANPAAMVPAPMPLVQPDQIK